uniref:Uncharacterized protein AlNc14C376G11171 n=1 Tax=Albugo laibachii Nc14 TaxID=890382 RepID=F0WYB2_9STRA|nr:conserved hypothetical protein [Albugo laibachii Nc14]|eukprot:CCA26464.1 conserved hypothetical protein [Albugo laibachii Nc14]
MRAVLNRAASNSSKAVIQPDQANVKDAIKSQVEFYFSRDNLANDTYLVSQMDSQMFVPIETILSFSKIQKLTKNPLMVADAIRDSKICVLSESEDAIRPSAKHERNTIILREIPSDTNGEKVRELFQDCGQVDVRSDVGDTWFVTFPSEKEAVDTLLTLREKKLDGAPIKARLKSENVVKSYFSPQSKEVEAANPLTDMYPNLMAANFYDSRAGYYDVASVYGYNTGGIDYYGRGNNYKRNGHGNDRRGYGASAQGSRRHSHSKSHGSSTSSVGSNREEFTGPRDKSHSFEHRSAYRKPFKGNGRRASHQQKVGLDTSANKQVKEGDHPGHVEPVLDASNFPPLQNGVKEDGDASQHSREVQFSYTHEDIIEIVKHMDDDDCKLKDDLEYKSHSDVVTRKAHPDLLRNQRTCSIEQAREALRHGRPIRSDSIGSIDYESMMYGEEYTIQVRAQRASKASQVSDSSTTKVEVTAPEDPASLAAQSKRKDTPPASGKIIGYAAAVIHGTPAPPVSVSRDDKSGKAVDSTPKSKGVPKSTPKGAKEPKKNSKRNGRKHHDHKRAIKVADNLPVAGAWGDRNFLDVVKSEPAAIIDASVSKSTSSLTCTRSEAQKHSLESEGGAHYKAKQIIAGLS